MDCNPAAPFFVAFVAFVAGAFFVLFWEAINRRLDK